MPKHPKSPYNSHHICNPAVPVNTSTDIKLKILRDQLEEQIEILEEKLETAGADYTEEINILKQQVTQITNEINEIEIIHNTLVQKINIIEEEVDEVQTIVDSVENISLDGGEIVN